MSEVIAPRAATLGRCCERAGGSRSGRNSALARAARTRLARGVSTSAEFSPSTLASLSLAGHGGGLVKRLGGFRKDRHTVPDAANPATQAFFARICANDLGTEAEEWFQRARTGFGYKRADIRLELGSASALLLARDFSFEIAWALDPRDPASYTITRTLRDVREATFVLGEACDDVFAGTFTQIVFTLSRGVSVESVIDAVEGLPAGNGFSIAYPANCAECTLQVAGVDAKVRCTGASLELDFPRAGSPRELIEAFGAIRTAFRFTGSEPLVGLA